MTTKKTPDENLLDAQLDFIMNTPQEQFDAYLVESRADRAEINRKATLAFDRAFENHAIAVKASQALARLTAPEQKVVAQNLGIRRQVLTAFREHRVEVSSIPFRFLSRFASELGQAAEALRNGLLAPAPALAGQYKSDEKPDGVPKRVTFEQLLREADMTEEEISQLMRDGE
jgi:hypothetical protein